MKRYHIFIGLFFGIGIGITIEAIFIEHNKERFINYSLSAKLDVIDEKLDRCGQCNEVATGVIEEPKEEELTTAEICVGVKNISIEIGQAKKFLECIGEQNGGYCFCVEKYASCDLRLTDIPEEFRSDFNPECASK